MSRPREYPLHLDISLESLPPPESRKREQTLVVRFTKEDHAKIEQAARGRGEPPATLCRTIVLTAFQDSALKALGRKPDLLEMTPHEQQRALLEIFGDSPPESRKPLPRPPKEVQRNRRMVLRFTEGELAMIERAANERGEFPVVLVRSIILKALENSERRAQDGKPDPRHMSPIEQQRVLLDALTFK